MDLSLIKRAVCYIRRSREDMEAELRGEDTLAKQRELMLKQVLPNYEFEYDLAEEVASGDSIRERPVFQQVFRDLELGKYQAIVCKDLTRLGRGSYGDMGVVYDLLLGKRIFVITQGNVFDPSKREHQQMLRFQLFFAREEYEMIKARLQDGKDIQARNGKWVQGSSIPFGYSYDSKEKKLVVNEEEAKIVQLIFDLYLNKEYGAKKICTYLKRLGIKTPKGKTEWSNRTIEFILSKPAYIGSSYYRIKKRGKLDGKVVEQPEENQIVVPHAHEPIIDEDTWEKVQERLKNSKNMPKVNLDFTPSELAALVTCKDCGKKMVRQSSTQSYTKKDGESSYYKKEYLYCKNCSIMVKYQNVENQVLHVLDQIASLDDQLLQEVLNDNLRSSSTRIVKSVEILNTLLRRKKELDDQLVSIYDKYERGMYSDDVFLMRRSEVEGKIKDTEKSIELAQKEDALSAEENVDVQQTRKNITSFLELYKNLPDKAKKNEELRSIFEKIELKFHEKGSRTKSEKFDLYVLFQYNFLSK